MQKKAMWLVIALTVIMSVMAIAQVKGPIPDVVYINVKMTQDVGIKDAAEGLTDIFLWGVDASVFLATDPADRDKLEVYAIPSGYSNLQVNPIPNEAPYQVQVGDKTYFNPFAIQDIRFAMNFLLSRKHIVDEIQLGTGGPMYNVVVPVNPGTYRYNLIKDKFGITEEGDEAKGLRDIEEAMQKAAALPENQGRLVKGAQYWEFDGEPVTLRFLIRSEDDRLRIGAYVSQQLEKAGFRVEQLIRDRVAIGQWYGHNPADYQYNMYTEGWGLTATVRWHDSSIAQMYASWYLPYMPGGNRPGDWNYVPERINELTYATVNGQFLTEEEYWELILEANELGLQDSVRIYLVYQTDFYATNKDRFLNRFLYGVGNGPDRWTFRSANTPDGILRITQFSARGTLFAGAWDPVGTDGFSDVYVGYLADPCFEMMTAIHPATGEYIGVTIQWDLDDLITDVSLDADGNMLGGVPVPEDALMFNPYTKKFEAVGPGLTSFAQCTYRHMPMNWHHGRRITQSDMLYVNQFIYTWMTKTSDDDLFFDQPYSTSMVPAYDRYKGFKINPDGSVTVWYDFFFAPDPDRIAANGVGLITLSATGRSAGPIPWEIYEALALLVVEGGTDDTVWSFTRSPDVEQVDLLAPMCVREILFKLMDMRARWHVPAGMEPYITPEEAREAYDLAIQWINEKGHAFISNGAFYIQNYDASTNFMELRANRDPLYPWTPDYWPNKLAVTRPMIEEIDLPFMVTGGQDVDVSVSVYEVEYPETDLIPTDQAQVRVILLAPDFEEEVQATMVAPGVFEAVIPGSVTDKLVPGEYNILALAKIGEVETSFVETLLVF